MLNNNKKVIGTLEKYTEKNNQTFVRFYSNKEFIKDSEMCEIDQWLSKFNQTNEQQMKMAEARKHKQKKCKDFKLFHYDGT